MDASSSRLRYLLHAHTNGMATPAERQELMAIIGTPGQEGTVEELIAGEMDLLEETDTEMRHPIPDERAARILSDILGSRPEVKVIPYATGPTEQKNKILRWGWRAAAAVILIISGTVGYRYMAGKTEILAAGKKVSPVLDPAPGGNKAVLQLANGSTIILDNAHTGKLAEQGRTNVIKLDSGQLAYTTLNENSNTVLYNTLTTPRGGQYQLILPDGSKVWLNAASSIKYPTAFTGSERAVSITGEAYFEIVKNDKKPFVVSAGATRTTVLGTHFNINAYDDEQNLSTTLLEGAVKFSSGSEEHLLRPGQQATLNNKTRSMVIQDADIYRAVAWKNGQFDFDNTDLPAIMRQISRWYDIDISYHSKYEGVKFGGGISRQLHLSDVLRLLDKSGVHTILEGSKLIILP